MINEGTHRARAIEAALGHAKTGSEEVAIQFEIVDGANAGERITWFGYFTEKTRDRTLRSLRYAGWDAGTLADLSSVGSVDVEIVVEHEPNQDGVLRERVRWVNPIGGGLRLPNRMTREQAERLASRFKRRRDRHISQAETDPPSESATENEDDELPF